MARALGGLAKRVWVRDVIAKLEREIMSAAQTCF